MNPELANVKVGEIVPKETFPGQTGVNIESLGVPVNGEAFWFEPVYTVLETSIKDQPTSVVSIHGLAGWRRTK